MAAADANLNALWSRAIAEELARGGARWAVLCPGSRNSPLLFALASQADLTCLSHVDERSAGFIALGLARASGAPAVVCVTSGSALANLLPAVTEAHACATPLIVLAADRPWELVGVGAPQAMPQPGLFGAHVVEELALGAPTLQDQVLRALRARVARLVQLARGPALINAPLRDPLPPIPDPAFAQALARANLSDLAAQGREGGWPFTLSATVAPAPAEATAVEGAAGAAGALAAFDWLRPGLRGLIVAGAGASARLCAGADALALASGFPLIADCTTALRAREGGAIACADALLGAELGLEPPELVIQVGPLPLARLVSDYLARQRCPWLCMEEDGNRDALARAWASLREPSPATIAAIGMALARGDTRWAARWRAADEAAREAQDVRMRDSPWDEVLAAHLACRHAGFRWLHLASSLAVRHGNLHCLAEPRARRIFANRGLNGIDGTIGTFLGEAMAQDGRGLLLIGDLATLHDLPALAAAGAAPRSPATIVVLENGGGGIFDFLPVAQVADWERWVRTPQSVDLVAAAAAFGLQARRVGDRRAFSQALDAAAAADSPSLIACAVPGGCSQPHRALIAAMAQAGAQAVNAPVRAP
jgi:2-succinyl-5-enolpyruvyl-6-hydroxy-3-cyclohexene-1-carboxylate synthase